MTRVLKIGNDEIEFSLIEKLAEFSLTEELAEFSLTEELADKKVTECSVATIVYISEYYKVGKTIFEYFDDNSIYGFSSNEGYGHLEFDEIRG